MAAAETVRKHLTCSICLEVFKKPKTLPCLHSFCEACLEEHIRSFCQTHKTFECPLCRAETHLDQQNTNDQWAKSYPTNHFIVSLIEDEVLHAQARSVDKNLAIECVPCSLDAKSVKAFCFCIQCVEYLCKECFEVHRKFKATRTHEVLKGNELPEDVSAFNKLSKIRFCNKHPDKDIEFKCNDDDMLFCSMCVTSEHKTCGSIKHISSIDEESQTKIDSFLEGIISLKMDVEKTLNCKLQEADALDKESKSVTKSSTEIIDKLKEYIKYIENRFITQYSEHIESEHKKHANAIGECFGLVEKLDMMINVTSTVLKYGSSVQKAVILSHLKDDEIQVEHRLAEQRTCSSNVMNEYLQNEKETIKQMLQYDFSGHMCSAETGPTVKDINATIPQHVFENESHSLGAASYNKINSTSNGITSNEKSPDVRVDKAEKTISSHLRMKTSNLQVANDTDIPSLFSCMIKRIAEYDISVNDKNSVLCFHNSSLIRYDGSLVFTDCVNNIVKLVSTDFKVKSYRKLESQPKDVVLWGGDNRIALSTVREIVVYSISDNSELGQQALYSIRLFPNSFCQLLSGYAFLFSGIDQVVPYVDIRSNKNEHIRSINKFSNIFGKDYTLNRPSFIRSRGSNELLIAEPQELKAFDARGNMKWFFKSKNVMYLNYIATDSQNNVYLCDTSAGNVYQLAEHNRRYESRILIADVPNPCSVVYDPKRMCLIVGAELDNKIYVYEYC